VVAVVLVIQTIHQIMVQLVVLVAAVVLLLLVVQVLQMKDLLVVKVTVEITKAKVEAVVVLVKLVNKEDMILEAMAVMVLLLL
jgi:uncharacterized protein (DUF58 family)